MGIAKTKGARYTDDVTTPLLPEERQQRCTLNPAYNTLPRLFNTRLLPALKSLLDAAVAAGEVRSGVDPEELIHAVANLCGVSHEKEPIYARRMVALLMDGLRYGATDKTIGAKSS